MKFRQNSRRIYLGYVLMENWARGKDIFNADGKDRIDQCGVPCSVTIPQHWSAAENFLLLLPREQKSIKGRKAQTMPFQ